MNKPDGMKPKKTRILVVDDDTVSARIVARVARFAGFDVREASNAIEAVIVAHAWKPELVIADVVMPGMDGSELCVVLKSDPETRDIPVLFVSAYADHQVAPFGEFCGKADCLVKPFTPVRLLRAINRILGRVSEMAS